MTADQTVLVSGGSGYIGGWCVVELLRRGYRVRTTLRRRSDEASLRERLAKAVEIGDRLSVFEAELDRDEGWDAAAEGCDFLLHVASPLGLDNPKRRDALVAPARDGALRALRAASRAGVRRAVLTSSVAAASPPHTAGDTLTDETVWTDPDDPKVGPYPLSKTLAEKAAWAFAAETPGFELAVINPALVLGPVLSPNKLGSVQLVQRLLGGSLPGCPRLGFNVVDVRDVADLHIRAMTDPAAAGQRFIAAGEYRWMLEIAELLKAELGARADKVPLRKIPDIVLRVLGLFDPAIRTVTDGLGQRRAFSSEKAQTRLAWSPRPARETILACAESLFTLGAV